MMQQENGLQSRSKNLTFRVRVRPHSATCRWFLRAEVSAAYLTMIGITAFRAISHEFACLALRHDGSGNTTARRQDKANSRSQLAPLGRAWQVSVCTLSSARQRVVP